MCSWDRERVQGVPEGVCEGLGMLLKAPVGATGCSEQRSYGRASTTSSGGRHQGEEEGQGRGQRRLCAGPRHCPAAQLPGSCCCEGTWWRASRARVSGNQARCRPSTMLTGVTSPGWSPPPLHDMGFVQTARKNNIGKAGRLDAFCLDAANSYFSKLLLGQMRHRPSVIEDPSQLVS